MNIDEIWLPVVDYINYEVSNLGNIRSKNRSTTNSNGITHTYKSINLKPSINKYGYYYVDLYANGNKRKMTVHRIVAIAFIPNPDNKPEVNHKDGIKANCTVSNLEWLTHAENNRHAFDTGLNIGMFGSDNPKSKPIIQLDKAGNVLNRFPSINEAQVKTGILRSHISECCRGKAMSAGGYVWNFDV